MTVRRLAILFVILLAIAAAGQALAQAMAQDHHPLHRDFYRSWMQPGIDPPLSCCNARVEKNGVETGDCEPTRAEIRAGQWWAWLRQESRWVPIPDAKVIRERNPNIFDAHLCWSSGRVLCFSPPDTGG